ncbi:proteasome regulatory subunit Rpn2 [Vibrio chagasii]|nr:proteasome regulatory subunit Rpn2 [Vibrio chagasii]CAH7302196.1 proteasome regulatory subunit Rpn2 [Vibrio chagasii]CAH7458364.1 proteasome regulatory subunit Rpn2 [Vibrio chagasii]CAH7480641.1 proteasome regulatory subunit Rpn2 [Vibrio chagasii]
MRGKTQDVTLLSSFYFNNLKKYNGIIPPNYSVKLHLKFLIRSDNASISIRKFTPATISSDFCTTSCSAFYLYCST